MRGMGPFLAPGCIFNSRISVFDAHGQAILPLSQWPFGFLFHKEYDSLKVMFRQKCFIIEACRREGGISCELLPNTRSLWKGYH